MAIVDVAVPCYRYGRYLEQCVKSVLTQSLQDVRVLIVDDGSPDGSGDVARALAASDPRVEASVHPENLGATKTYNEGIVWARSPYFLLLSADDYLAPFALERAVALMESDPEVVLTSGACVDYFEGRPGLELDQTPGSPEWRVRPGRALVEDHCERVRNLVPTPTAIVRTATQKAIGGYLPTLPHTGDLEMWLRFAAHGKVADTPRVQGVYRVHGANMSAAYYRDVLRDYTQRADAFDTFFDSAGHLVEGAEKLHSLAKRRLAAAAFWTGIAQYVRGHHETGLKVLRFGLELNPRMRFVPPVLQLLRHERPDRRLISVIADFLKNRAASASARPAGTS